MGFGVVSLPCPSLVQLVPFDYAARKQLELIRDAELRHDLYKLLLIIVSCVLRAHMQAES